MSNLNFANRYCCDVDIRDAKTKKPILFLDTANVTTAGFTGDSVYSTKKGARAIGFQNPVEGTLTVECNTFPKGLIELFTSSPETSAVYAKKEIIECETAGELSIADASSVYVYALGDYGGTNIVGSYAAGKFTATTPADLAVDTQYEVGYLVTKSTGVTNIKIDDLHLPKDHYITFTTLNKDENGDMNAEVITAYKCVLNRDFEMSFNSTGDPLSIQLNWDVVSNKDGDVMDISILS